MEGLRSVGNPIIVDPYVGGESIWGKTPRCRFDVWVLGLREGVIHFYS